LAFAFSLIERTRPFSFYILATLLIALHRNMKLNILLPMLASIGLAAAQRPSSYPPNYFDQPVSTLHNYPYSPEPNDFFAD
jgi:hypothetical protein